MKPLCILCLAAIVVWAALLGTASAASASKFQHLEEWMLWKDEHGKEYYSEKDELEKHIIWLSNKKYIDEHNANADKFGFRVAMNQFGDMTAEEYEASHSCYKPPNVTSFTKKYGRRREYVAPKFLSLPDTVDWRTKNAVTDVKNQGQCGSCYAFSATGALEGAHSLAHDRLVSLSEQNVLDCSVPYGNHGCNGGNMHNVYEYVIDNQGIDIESSYPYKGRQGQCHFNKGAVGATQAGVVTIPSGSESDLQAATATAGPISIAMDGSSNAFRFYAGGIFDEPNCSTTKLTHSMLIIGYGTYKEKDYWLLKNSWGSNWGMNGYVMMVRNKSNQCGIATAASFPTL